MSPRTTPKPRQLRKNRSQLQFCRLSTSARLFVDELEDRRMLSVSTMETGWNLRVDASQLTSSVLAPSTENLSVPSALRGKVSTSLWSAVIDEAGAGPHAVSSGLSRVDATGAIQTYIHVSQWNDALASALTAKGVVIEQSLLGEGLLQARVPYAMVDDVATLSGVQTIDLPSYATVDTGSVESEGDAIVRATQVRSQYAALGIDGSGVKVGVLSNGDGGLSSSVATGNLPSNVTVDLAGSGSEGTAMMEIVHDLAPGASLYFSGASTSVEMVNSINWMVAQGCNVIVDDLSFLGLPYFSDGDVANAASSAIASGVTYVTAAGNYSADHYQSPFVSGGSSGNGLWQDFGSGDVGEDVIIPAGATFSVYLQWSDPWGASSNNYDLYMFDPSTGLPITSSTTVQNGSQNPFESITVTNTGGSAVQVALAVDRLTGAASREIEMYMTGDSAIQYDVPADSIFGQAAVTDVISVGAIDQADSGHNDAEFFSSQGPSTIYTSFSPQTPTQRHTLDGMSIDGVATSVSGFSPFYGTSAAAPHAAAIAALVLDAHPGLTPAQVSQILDSTAVDINASGYDDATGAGRFDAFLAVSKALAPWQNADFPQDTNHGGYVSPIDALYVINYLALNGVTHLSAPTDYSGSPPAPPTYYIDVSGDNLVSPLDALRVINYLITQSQPASAASIRLAAVDMEGNPITSVSVGQQFQIQTYVTDTSSSPEGNYAVYNNLNFDASRAELASTVDFPSAYTVTINDQSQAGVLDAGAVLGDDDVGSTERLLYTATYTATLAGQVDFTTSGSDQDGQDILNLGNDDPVSAGNVNFGSLSLAVTKVPLEYTASSAATLKVTTSGDYYQVLDVSIPGSPVVVASQLIANTSAINITGSTSADSVTFDASVMAIPMAISVTGGAGADTVTVDDSGDTTTGQTYTILSDGATVGLTTVAYSGVENVVVTTGTSGTDVINALSSPGATTVNATGHLSQIINVGDSTHPLTGISTALYINGYGSRLNFDDSADTLANVTYTMADHSLNVVANSVTYPVSFNSIGAGLSFVSGTQSSDVFNMPSSPGGLEITATGSGQTFNFGASAHSLSQDLYNVTITGNQSTVNFDDSSTSTGQTYSLNTSTFIPTSGGATYSYSSLSAMSILTGSGNNGIRLLGSGADLTTITAGAGHDTFTWYTSTTIAPSQYKPLAIDGGANVNTLNVYDSGSSGNHTYAFTSTGVSGHGKLTRDSEPSVVDWTNATLSFTGGTGNDTLTINNPGADLTVSGGDGNDALHAVATASGTTVTLLDFVGTNSFTVGASNTLSGIQGTLILNGSTTGGAPRPDVVLDDTAATGSSLTYTFAINGSSKDTVSRAGMGTIQYQTLNSLTFMASTSAADTINAAINDSGATTTEIDGGSLNDTITVTTGPASGTLNIYGNDGDDTITLQTPGSSLVSYLYGGNGNDSIVVGKAGQAYMILHDVHVIDDATGSNSLNVYVTLNSTNHESINIYDTDNSGTFTVNGTIDGGEGNDNTPYSADIVTYTNIGTRAYHTG